MIHFSAHQREGAHQLFRSDLASRVWRFRLGIRYFVALALSALLIGAPKTAFSADLQEAREFIASGISTTFQILRSKDLDQKGQVERLRLEMRKNFDIPAIGTFSLGAYARYLRPDQRAEYLGAVEDFVVNAYIARLVHYAPSFVQGDGDILRIVGARSGGRSDVLVITEIPRKDEKPVPVVWRVRGAKGAYRVVDVIIFGMSQALTYRDVFTSFIQNNRNDVGKLIDALRTKSDMLVTHN